MEYSQLDNAKRPAMTRLAGLWGLYAGLGLCFIAVLQNFILKSNGGGIDFAIGMLNFAIMIILFYFGMKTYGDTTPNLPFSYGLAVRFGMYQSLFASIILTAFFTLIIFVLKPNYIQLLEQAAIEQYKEMGLNEDAMERGMKFARLFMTPGWLISSTLVGTWFSGLIASLVAAAMARKK